MATLGMRQDLNPAVASPFYYFGPVPRFDPPGHLAAGALGRLSARRDRELLRQLVGRPRRGRRRHAGALPQCNREREPIPRGAAGGRRRGHTAVRLPARCWRGARRLSRPGRHGLLRHLLPAPRRRRHGVHRRGRVRGPLHADYRRVGRDRFESTTTPAITRGFYLQGVQTLTPRLFAVSRVTHASTPVLIGTERVERTRSQFELSGGFRLTQDWYPQGRLRSVAPLRGDRLGSRRHPLCRLGKALVLTRERAPEHIDSNRASMSSKWSRVVAMVAMMAAVCGLASAAACRRETVAPPPPAARNVVIITIDTLARRSRRRLRLCGGADAVARRTRARWNPFDRAYAPAPITLTSHASLMTGRYPPGHGAGTTASESSRRAALAEHFQRAGFTTGAFVAAFPLDRRFGLARGFQTYGDRMPRVAGAAGERTARAAGQWTRRWPGSPSHRPARFFLWVHLFEPHAPYGRPARRPPDVRTIRR